MKNKRTTQQAGFTLIEILVGLLSASVLALVVGVMLVSGYSSWRYNNSELEMQRDASLAMETIGLHVREATRGEVTAPGGNALFFEDTNVTNVSVNGDQLILNPGNFPLVRGRVQSFQATILPNQSIRVILQLHDSISGSATVMAGTYWPRNLP